MHVSPRRCMLSRVRMRVYPGRLWCLSLILIPQLISLTSCSCPLCPCLFIQIQENPGTNLVSLSLHLCTTKKGHQPFCYVDVSVLLYSFLIFFVSIPLCTGVWTHDLSAHLSVNLLCSLIGCLFLCCHI